MVQHNVKNTLCIMGLFMALCMVQGQTGKAPAGQKNEISLVKDEKNHDKEAKFIDIKTGKTLKTLNINDNNPFLKKYSKYKVAGGNHLDFSDTLNRPVFKLEKSKRYSRDNTGAIVDEGGTGCGAYSQFGYLIIGCGLQLMSGKQIVLGNSFIQVYNNLAEKICELNVTNVSLRQLTITRDGKYLLGIFGEQDADGHAVPFGYQIYHVQKKQLVYEQIFGPEVQEANRYSFGETFRVQYLKDDHTVGFIMFDFNKATKMVYERPPKYDRKIIDIAPDGLIMKEPNGDTTLMRYDTDFSHEKIIWQ